MTAPQTYLQTPDKGGKLIVDGTFGILDDTPAENVRAMFAAARKYAS
jgi:hypothetical protein